MGVLWEHLQYQDLRVTKTQVIVGNLLLEVIKSKEDLILQLRVMMVVLSLRTITTCNIISTTNMTDHLRVFSLILVGVVFSSLVHLEFRGASMESVSYVDNVDTSCLIALKGNLNPQIRDLQLQNL